MFTCSELPTKKICGEFSTSHSAWRVIHKLFIKKYVEFLICRVVSIFFWMEFSPRNNFHSFQKSVTYVLFETNPDKPVFSTIWNVNMTLWIHAQWHVVESESLTSEFTPRHCICVHHMRGFVNKVYYKWDLNTKITQNMLHKTLHG